MKPSQELIKKEPERFTLDRPVESVPLNYNYGVDPNAENEVHLLDYWRAIRKRLWLVICIVVMVTMLAVVYAARKPDIYEAKARVQVNVDDSSQTSVGAVPFIFGMQDDPVYFNTQLQILVSAGLIRRVVRTLDLEHNPDFLKSNPSQKRSTLQAVLQTLGVKAEKPLENKNADQLPLSGPVAEASDREDLAEAQRLAPYVGAILGGLQVEPVKENRGFLKETRLIDITFQHTDPQVAQKVVNTVAETYKHANLEKKVQTTSSTGDFLQKRVAELQENIRSAEERLVNYAKNNQIVSLDASQNTVMERLAGLNRQLLEAENERKTAEAALNAAKAPGAANALIEGETKQAGDLESKLNDLRQKRAQLLVDATEEAPEVKEIDGQIAELDKQIKELRSRKSSTLVTNLTTRYKQALEREQLLRKSFEQQRGETLNQNEAAINYRIIQQGIETNKTMLNSLLQRSKENDVAMAGKSNNISIVDYALTPDGPVGPNRTRTIFVSIFLALGFGVGLSLFLEYLDDTVRSTEDVERLLHLPALAVIPPASGAVKRKLGVGSGGLQKRNGNPGNISNNAELLINVDGRSPLAESYRHLRTSVLLSTAGRSPKSLLVTSSLPGEGKTTTAVNTSYSLAQTGASVVIVDADMRRPRLQSIFGMRGQLGLSSILSSDVTEEEMLAMVSKDETSGLHVLTAGPIPPNPAELIGSEQMRRLVTSLQRHFTHVVIDSPPVSSFTDGVLISTMVDGVLLVVHGGKSSRHVVRRSRQLLQDVGAKIFGVVLNNTQIESHDYYYQRYYSEKYYGNEEAGV